MGITYRRPLEMNKYMTQKIHINCMFEFELTVKNRTDFVAMKINIDMVVQKRMTFKWAQEHRYMMSTQHRNERG